MSLWSRAGFLIVLAAVLGGPAVAGEWSGWRGPAQNGVSGETGLVSSWSPEGENLIWKADFIGRSTPVVFDGQACVIGRVGEGIERQEIVACFDAANGNKRWEHRFNVYNTTVPFNRVGWASLVGDPETGHIYAHGVAGQLICYDHDGRIVWSRFLAEEVGRLSGYGGRTQTPLIEGDQLILSFVSSGWGGQAAPRHRYFSFDKLTGEILWVSTPGVMPHDMNTQSVPVVAEIKGRRLLVSGNADGWVYALSATTGEKVWSFHLSRRGLNSSVLVEGDRVYASHSEENLDDPTMGRVVCIDGTGKGDVTATHELWRINEVTAGFPSPTYGAGRLYVVDNSANLHAIDTATGKIVWTHSVGTVGKGSPVLADGKLYVTEVNGRFHIIEPGKDSARALDSDELRVADGRYAEIYGSPAIAYGRIYFATEGGVYCVGRKDVPFAGASKKRKRAKSGPSKPVKGEAAWIRVVPAERIVAPGESVRFEIQAFDARDRPLGARKATWQLNGLGGAIDDDGRYTAPAGGKFAAGTVTAKVGAVQAEARLRVIPGLPWVEDFESFDAGQVPRHWIGAAKKFEVREVEGNKVLVKLVRPKGLLRNATYMGPSTMSGYTIEADVMGTRKGRRLPDIGLIANGYTLDLMGAHQRIQVRSWASEERMARQVPFAWELERWYHMKLRVDVDGKKGLIRGKVWPAGEREPADWTITVEDPLPIASGSPGLLGYSPADLYYDNLKVTVND